MHVALNRLADHLLLMSSGTNLQNEFGWSFFLTQTSPGIALNNNDLTKLWQALETQRLLVPKGPAGMARDIVVDDIIPARKRVSMTVQLWKPDPTIDIFVEGPRSSLRAGSYGASYTLAFPQRPSSFAPEHNRNGEGLFNWLRGFLSYVYPAAQQQHLRGNTSPTGIPFVDRLWPDRLPANCFGIDQVQVTTNFDPQTRQGGVESVELTFSTPTQISPAPLPRGRAVPNGITTGGIFFAKASPDGVSVVLRFKPNGDPDLATIDGAVIFDRSSIPLEWTSREPSVLSGAFEAGTDADDDPAFPIYQLATTLDNLAPMFTGVEHILIDQAEVRCDLDSGEFEFVGQSVQQNQIAGLQCADIELTLRGNLLPNGLINFQFAMLRGIAELQHPTYFRTAVILHPQYGWIHALEANYSTQKWTGQNSFGYLVAFLRTFQVPVRTIGGFGLQPQTLQLDEQRRGDQNEFDELLGRP